MTKEIALNKGHTALVDEADFPLVGDKKWSVLHAGSRKYAIASVLTAKGKRSSTLMHRVIMSPGPGLVVDHINGDGLNNTRSNLRICTHSQNTFARHSPPKTETGYRGVYRRDSKFLARMGIGAPTYLGSYLTPIEAAFAHYIGCAIIEPEFSTAERRPEFSDIPTLKRLSIAVRVSRLLGKPLALNR